MKRIDLIESAGKLVQVDEMFAKEYESKRDILVDLMNKKMVSRADIKEMVGELNIEMMKDNHANHARFMESIFTKHSPEVLVDTILWVFRAYQSRNFSSTYWAAQLNSWIDILKKELTSDCYVAIYPYYNWMQINIPNFVALCDNTEDISHSVH